LINPNHLSLDLHAPLPSDARTLIKRAFVDTMRYALARGRFTMRRNNAAISAWVKSIRDPRCRLADHVGNLGTILGIEEWPAGVRNALRILITAIVDMEEEDDDWVPETPHVETPTDEMPGWGHSSDEEDNSEDDDWVPETPHVETPTDEMSSAC